ncbi:U1 small nuclear ribonucleoprotein 70 kDa-like [Convolutriloba macropyga]|uniref:U1 small nuclear ribonucleoprotein 70 kDa-like n=1 Tax=Convolutriloba macropyga TaxID=536237 RepID=UPI003F522653
MTYCLPPNLLALFTPREPIPFLPPNGKLPHEKKRDHQGGIAQLVQYFETTENPPEKVKVETKDERKARVTGEKAKLNEARIHDYLDAGLYDPSELQDATADSFKTLFVARLNYDTSESKLRREFEHYGPIRKIKFVKDLSGKPRGYAFIEYEHERDMRSAYKHADGKKIDGRRVLVDVERARTVEGWLPRRLGGGLGNTRRSLLPKWKRELGYDDHERRRSDSRNNNRSSGGESSRRRRSRSRDKDRERDRGHKRDREREKEKEKEKGTAAAAPAEGTTNEEGTSRKRSRSKERKRKRSRSRDKDQKESKRKRSRSREKKRKRSRDRGDRERDRDHKEKGMNGSATVANGNDVPLGKPDPDSAASNIQYNGGPPEPGAYDD